MLRWRILDARGHLLEHGVEAHLLVVDLLPQDLRQNPGNLLVRVFDRPEQGVDLAVMRCGILQNPHEQASLILGGNGGVATGPVWLMEHAVTDHRSQIQHPLSKVCWPEKGYGDS